MPVPVEIVGVSTVTPAGVTLPVADPVNGTTADVATGNSQQSWLKRTQYKNIAAGSTWLLSTYAIIDTITVIPASSGTGTVTLADGTTNIMVIPAVGHLDAKPYSLNLGGIANQSTAGFKVIAGASVAVIVKGAFVGTPTTA